MLQADKPSPPPDNLGIFDRMDRFSADLLHHTDSVYLRMFQAMDTFEKKWEANQPDEMYEKFMVPTVVGFYEISLRSAELLSSALNRLPKAKIIDTKTHYDVAAIMQDDDYLAERFLRTFISGAGAIKKYRTPLTDERVAKFARRITASYCRELLKVGPKLKNPLYQTAPNKVARSLFGKVVSSMRKDGIQAIDPEFTNLLAGELLHPSTQTPVLLEQFVTNPPLEPEGVTQ